MQLTIATNIAKCMRKWSEFLQVTGDPRTPHRQLPPGNTPRNSDLS